MLSFLNVKKQAQKKTHKKSEIKKSGLLQLSKKGENFKKKTKEASITTRSETDENESENK
jgi:hypothetical protein